MAFSRRRKAVNVCLPVFNPQELNEEPTALFAHFSSVSTVSEHHH